MPKESLLESFNTTTQAMEHSINITDRIPASSVDRWQRALSEMLTGYTEKTGLEVQFPSNGSGAIISKGIAFSSVCRHHLMPFFGTVDVGYVPRVRICGLSKLARTVGVFSRRLQLQEELTTQIANELNSTLNPIGVLVKIRANHSCQQCRGVQKNAELITMKTIGSCEEIIRL